MMTKETANRILLFLKRNCRFYKGVNINWFGGEPLLEKEFVIWFMKEAGKICKEAKVPLTGSMSTNGYLLDEECFKALVKCKVIYFQITVDGTKESHNFQRPHVTDVDSYQKIVDNLKVISLNVKGYYKITIRINITKSIEKYIDNVIENFKIFSNNDKFRIHWQFVRDFGGEQVHALKDEMVTDFGDINRYIDYATDNGIAVCMNLFWCWSRVMCCMQKSFFYIRSGGEGI